MATEQIYLGGNRRSVRPWLIGLALTLGVALIVLWLTGGGEDGSRIGHPSTPRSGASEESSGSVERQGPHDSRGAIETSEVFAPKDPFDPLVSTKSVSGAPSSASTKSSAHGVGDHKLVLVAASSRGGGSAEVRVNGTVHTVSRGETFSDHFKLLAASGECVAMLFGDQEFTLCEGEEILK